MPYGVVNADKMTTSDGVSSSGLYGFKNRLINSAMVIDQRNAGASVTLGATDTYNLDRWVATATQASKLSVQQNAGSVTPPAGFSKYLGLTSLTAYSITTSDIFTISQAIEGLNVADLGWGAVGASSVTLSFWVRSSLTGTFGASLSNSGNSRCYPFTYTISSANTWEQKSVTIAGDTSGTWLTTNGIGIFLRFGLGVGSTFSGTAGAWTGTANTFSATGATSVVGTNGATFYLTGVQLEKGSTATSFDYRPYSTELQLCQRYCYVISGNSQILGTGYNRATTRCDVYATFPVTMRASPTGTVTSGTNYYYVDYSQATTNMNSFTVNSTTPQNAFLLNTGLSGLTAGSGNSLWTNSASAFVSYSAEL